MRCSEVLTNAQGKQSAVWMVTAIAGVQLPMFFDWLSVILLVTPDSSSWWLGFSARLGECSLCMQGVSCVRTHLFVGKSLWDSMAYSLSLSWWKWITHPIKPQLLEYTEHFHYWYTCWLESWLASLDQFHLLNDVVWSKITKKYHTFHCELDST